MLLFCGQSFAQGFLSIGASQVYSPKDISLITNHPSYIQAWSNQAQNGWWEGWSQGQAQTLNGLNHFQGCPHCWDTAKAAFNQTGIENASLKQQAFQNQDSGALSKVKKAEADKKANEELEEKKKRLEEECEEEKSKQHQGPAQDPIEDHRRASLTAADNACEELEKLKEEEESEEADSDADGVPNDVEQIRDNVLQQMQDKGYDTAHAKDSFQRFEDRMVDLGNKRSPDGTQGWTPETAATKMRETYQNLDNFLANGGDPKIADNVLLHVGDPTTIDQGANPTCNFCQAEKHIAAVAPEKYSDIATQVSLTGKYNGTEIPASEWRTVQGQGESYFNMDNAREGGQRSPVSKIVTATTRYLDNSSNAGTNAPATYTEVRSIAQNFAGEPIRYTSDYNNPAAIAEALRSGKAPYIATVTSDGGHAYGLYATPDGRLIIDNQWGGERLFEKPVALTPQMVAMAESMMPGGTGAFRGPLDGFFGGSNYMSSLLSFWGMNGYNGIPAAMGPMGMFGTPFSPLGGFSGIGKTPNVGNVIGKIPSASEVISKTTGQRIVDSYVNDTVRSGASNSPSSGNTQSPSRPSSEVPVATPSETQGFEF